MPLTSKVTKEIRIRRPKFINLFTYNYDNKKYTLHDLISQIRGGKYIKSGKVAVSPGNNNLEGYSPKTDSRIIHALKYIKNLKSLDFNGYITYFLVKLIKKSKKLSIIRVSPNHKLYEMPSNLLSRHKKLNHLEIRNDISHPAVTEFTFKKFSNPLTLVLSNSTLPLALLKQINLLLENNKLVDLRLANILVFEDKRTLLKQKLGLALNELATGLKKNTSLFLLDLSDNHTSNISPLIDALENHPRLKDLNLAGNLLAINTKNSQSLKKLLVNNKSIQYLNLLKNNVRGVGEDADLISSAKLIASGLLENQTLIRLCFDGDRLLLEIIIIEGCENHPTLTHFSTGTDYTIDQIISKYTARYIFKMKHLQSLHVFNYTWAQDSQKIFNTKFERNQTITSLQIDLSTWQKDNIEAFGKILQKKHHLQSLYISIGYHESSLSNKLFETIINLVEEGNITSLNLMNLPFIQEHAINTLAQALKIRALKNKTSRIDLELHFFSDSEPHCPIIRSAIIRSDRSYKTKILANKEFLDIIKNYTILNSLSLPCNFEKLTFQENDNLFAALKNNKSLTNIVLNKEGQKPLQKKINEYLDRNHQEAHSYSLHINYREHCEGLRLIKQLAAEANTIYEHFKKETTFYQFNFSNSNIDFLAKLNSICNDFHTLQDLINRNSNMNSPVKCEATDKQSIKTCVGRLQKQYADLSSYLEAIPEAQTFVHYLQDTLWRLLYIVTLSRWTNFVCGESFFSQQKRIKNQFHAQISAQKTSFETLTTGFNAPELGIPLQHTH